MNMSDTCCWMAVWGLWMPTHSILDCVNSLFLFFFAAWVPMVCVSAVQRKTVMWDSGLRLRKEPNSWVDCYFWIELSYSGGHSILLRLLEEAFTIDVYCKSISVSVCIQNKYIFINLLIYSLFFLFYSIYLFWKKKCFSLRQCATAK